MMAVISDSAPLKQRGRSAGAYGGPVRPAEAGELGLAHVAALTAWIRDVNPSQPGVLHQRPAADKQGAQRDLRLIPSRIYPWE